MTDIGDAHGAGRRRGLSVMSQRTLSSPWVTVGLVLLAVPNLVAGLWGIVAPEHWYENFPGWGPRLVAAIPPYNEHLAFDAASGLFAAGVVAAAALLVRRRDVVIVAMVAYLAFSFPHAMFHLAHPADALSGREDVVNTLTLWTAVAIAAAIGAVAWLGTTDTAAGEAPGGGGRPTGAA